MTLTNVLHSTLLTIGVYLGAATWSAGWCYLNGRGAVTRKFVRKVAHMSAAPVMMVSWALYPAPSALSTRLLAALVPLLFAVRLYASRRDDTLCTSSSRSGDSRESRGGPFAYCATMTVTISLVGPHRAITYAIVAGLMGDGMAEIVGENLPSVQWPLPKSWKRKSVAGTLAFAVTCFICTCLFLEFARVTGLCTESVTLARIGAVSMLCSVAEMLPFEDNYSVPLAATLAFT